MFVSQVDEPVPSFLVSSVVVPVLERPFIVNADVDWFADDVEIGWV